MIYDKQQKREYDKEYRKKNKTKKDEYHKKWREQNKEYIKIENKKWRIANKEYIWETQIKKKYNFTPEKYNRLLEQQNYKCAICYVDKPGGRSHGKWFIDHNHKTNEVRKLLCHHCNTGLGAFKDSPELLNRALNYLKAHDTECID